MNSTEIVIPILMRWKVSKEEIRLKLQRQTKLYKMVPLFPGVKYGLVIERTDQNKIFVSLSFEMKQSKDIKAKFKISFIPKNGFFWVETYERVFKYALQGWGDTICTFEEFFDDGNNYFIDNFIYITLEGIVSCKNNMQKDCVCSYNLGELLYNQDDKDFEIYSTNGKCVKVHKLVISAKSSVFDRMIHSSYFKESKENKVLIKDFDYEIIKIAIKYCYRISIFESLNISIGIELLQFADKYDISDLKDSMEMYLFRHKSLSNICEIFNASIFFNLENLRQQCSVFMFEWIKESPFVKDFESLDKNIPSDLLNAFCSSLNI